MVSFYFDRTPAENFDQLVDKFPNSAFSSPTRSTVPLLAYWKTAVERLDELGHALGIPITSPVNLHFEYTVPVSQGRGKPSCTDLMIVSSSSAIAIEAKFTEPRYETVREWLRNAATDNRDKVVAGWLDTIRKVCGVTVAVTDVADLPYQLIHRAASACSVRAPVLSVGYFVFGTANAHYVDDLAAFRRVADPNARLKVFVLECSVSKIPGFVALEDAKRSGHSVAANVRETLKRAPLLQFGSVRQSVGSLPAR